MSVKKDFTTGVSKATNSSGIILRSAGPDGVFGNTSDDDDLLSDIIK